MQVKKAGVVFYEMPITQQHIDDGFAIGAHSLTGSRFKLLLFEQAQDGQWELLVQAWTCPLQQQQSAFLVWAGSKTTCGLQYVQHLACQE